MMATNILDYNSLDKNVKHSSLLISNKASDDLYATFMNNIKIDGIDSKNFTERQAFEFLKDDIVLSIDFLLQEGLQPKDIINFSSKSRDPIKKALAIKKHLEGLAKLQNKNGMEGYIKGKKDVEYGSLLEEKKQLEADNKQLDSQNKQSETIRKASERSSFTHFTLNRYRFDAKTVDNIVKNPGWESNKNNVYDVLDFTTRIAAGNNVFGSKIVRGFRDMEKRNISKIVAKAKPKLQKASEEAKSKDDPQAQVAISSLQRNMAKALREHYKMQGISPEELEKDAEQSLAA